MTEKMHTQRGLSLLALALITTTSVGCKSSNFSMPKMKMFSWNRQPDAATLAGNTQPAGLPESPAGKYSPTALATTTGKSSTSGTPSSLGSAYGYGATGSATGSPSGSTAQPGLAATANGYQTGPYQLAPKTSTAPSTTVASTATAGTLPTGSLPSPYGGTYSGTAAKLMTNTGTTAKPNIPLPSSITAALAQGTNSTTGAASSGGLPALPGGIPGTPPATIAVPAGYASNGSGQTPASTSAYQMMPSPPAYPASNPYSPGTTVGSLSEIPAPGSFTQPPPATTLTPANAPAAGLPAYPGQGSNGQPAASTSAGTTAVGTTSSAYQGGTTPGTYSPGSTGRSTSYDFSGGTGKSGSTTSSGSTTLSTGAPTSGTQPLLR